MLSPPAAEISGQFTLPEAKELAQFKLRRLTG